jgi:hypothetical protein
MKALRALFILLLIFCVTNVSGLTLAEEEKIVDDLMAEVEVYVNSTDWSEKRNYDKEAKDIGNIIKKFGWDVSQYGVFIMGDVTGFPDKILISLEGKTSNDDWMLEWDLKGEEIIEGPPECVPKSLFDMSCKKYYI